MKGHDMHIHTGWLLVTAIWTAALIVNIVCGGSQRGYFLCFAVLCVSGTLTLTA